MLTATPAMHLLRLFCGTGDYCWKPTGPVRNGNCDHMKARHPESHFKNFWGFRVRPFTFTARCTAPAHVSSLASGGGMVMCYALGSSWQNFASWEENQVQVVFLLAAPECGVICRGTACDAMLPMVRFVVLLFCSASHIVQLTWTTKGSRA